MSVQPDGSNQGRIPFRLRIGVTGHRRLEDEEALAAQVRRALQRIRQLAPSSPYTLALFTVVSPLAEGADRLVAREVLRDPEAHLEAPLPLPREEYLCDFETDESRREFDGFLARAKTITEMPSNGSREEAYERVGRYVVDRCDVLIALWEGEPSRGQGGTAEIVAYARERKVPLIWIATKGQHEIVEEVGDGINPRPFRELDEYNRLAITRGRFDQAITHHEGYLLPEDRDGSHHKSVSVQAFSDWVLPYFVRADLLAQRYHTWYHALGNALFLLAAAAVAAVAGQVIFASETLELVWIEAGLLLVLLLIVAVGRRWRFHRRWLTYRFLAERFRSALFLALAGLGGRREVRLERIYPSDPSEEWLRRGFAEVWDRRPQMREAESNMASLRSFLSEAWIQDQIQFYDKTSRKHKRRHTRLSRISEALFGATIVAAVLHAVGVGEHASAGPLSWADLLIFLAISLPTLATALGGIRVQREYERNAARYSGMKSNLEGLKARMEAADSLDAIRTVAAETEELMLEENRDWLFVMRFHDIVVPAG